MTRRLDLRRTPEALFLEIADEPGAVFLDSADGAGWSLLAADPSARSEALVPAARGPRLHAPEDPPFLSGWIGFLSYEAAPLLDRDLRVRPAEVDLPLAWWGRYDAALLYRHEDRAWFLTHPESEAGRAWLARLSASRARRADAHASAHATTLGDRRDHEERVGRLLQWIAAGHIYQANLTYRITAPVHAGDAELYRALRASNPAPYGAYLKADDRLAILSSSPELFLRVRGREVVTRPIKGTRPRELHDPERDRALARELLQSEKDRAELTMIVDLERNDLGKVAETGSVRVDPFPELESYRSVHHLVATVRATLRPDVDPPALLRATFPGGSVTGAPKIRAMELLAEMETAPRFVYTGALGWIDDSGDMELNLPIRTLWTRDGAAHLGVGGGIVAGSTPEAEWEETLHKAEAVLRALDPTRT